MYPVDFKPLTTFLYHDYITVGTIAYNQYYRHLWPEGNTATYIQNSFTKEVLIKEEGDENSELFVITLEERIVGILKLSYEKALANYRNNETLFLDKIYIKKEYSGKGIGKAALNFIATKAKNKLKKVVFLEAMQKGMALPFYVANGFSIIGTTQVPFNNVIEEEKPMYILLKEI